MCGLTGFFQPSSFKEDGARAILDKMATALIHRGPDSDGFWLDAEAGIALAHRRLSILDLSPAGAQPMPSASGRFVIVFNGEIYNHQEMRHDMEATGAACAWNGHSDTETLLAGFEIWGFEATLRRARGMFAMALWDRRDRCLYLARDPMGEKPLYYGWQGQGRESVFLFGSELKALRRHPSFEGHIDQGALATYLEKNAVGGSLCIYKKLAKLEPGCFLVLSARAKEAEIFRYWSIAEQMDAGRAKPFSGSAQDAVETLAVLLKDAVRSQMLSDVPLGAFLSGGVDSSTIVALMQAQSMTPVRTFSIGFEEEVFDEAPMARAVASHLKTAHTELYVPATKAQSVIPLLPRLYDEPFADSSQIPTYLVAEMTRHHVTVALSGDAGDELFSGYTLDHRVARLWSFLRRIPAPLRSSAGHWLGKCPVRALDAFSLLSANRQFSGDKLRKLANVLDSRSVEDLYRSVTAHWKPEDIMLSDEQRSIGQEERPACYESLSPLEKIFFANMTGYLTDDILVKVDRAAMGVSLETRVPMLDPRVIAFACSLPMAYKVHQGQTKWVLRQVLQRYVPSSLIDRPKKGFDVPLATWLRGPLKEWAAELLDERRLEKEGLFNAVPILQKWNEHLSGQRDWSRHLWVILMFEAWQNEQAHV